MDRKIIDIWVNVNKTTNSKPETDIETLIYDCFIYKIFTLKPSNKYKKWFKDCYGIEYPIYMSELTSSVIKELKSTIKFKKQEEKLEEKKKQQRYKRGYADVDVWNFNDWLSEMTAKMLKQLAEEHMGHPLINEEGNHIKDSHDVRINAEEIDKKWTEILERMSFLASELNEETCSLHKEQEEIIDRWWSFHEQFEKEYGNGESLKTEEEKQYEKEQGVKTMIFPDRHPDKQFVKEYNKAAKELRDFEKKMFIYQNKCKNELFDLLKKYYWDLWD